MYDKARVYAHAGLQTYWVIDPLHDAVTLTEFVLGDGREYEPAAHTAEAFTTERPWKVSVDLPALSRRWKDLMARRGVIRP